MREEEESIHSYPSWRWKDDQSFLEMDELLRIKVKTTGDTDLLSIQYEDVEKFEQ